MRYSPMKSRTVESSGVRSRAATNCASFPQAVALIVQRRCAAAGFAGDPAGNWMRSGFVTTAAGNGVDALEISNQTRHKSLDMVKRHTRPATIWKSNAASGSGSARERR